MSQNNIEIYEVYPTDEFNDNIEFYIRKKKYKHITKNINDVLENLKCGIFNGKIICDLKLGIKNNTYKIRAINTDTQQGKSNGYRLIYYVEKDNKIVFLLTIYYKKDEDRIPTEKEIVELIKRECE